MSIEGGCYCKRIRYSIAGDAVAKGQCFCRECQHIAGGGPATIMAVQESDFHYFSGAPKTFARTDLAEPVRREFCPECGTHLVSRSSRAPGLALVKVGTLDDPSCYGMPANAIHFRERYPFHAVAEGVRVFDGAPTRG